MRKHPLFAALLFLLPLLLLPLPLPTVRGAASGPPADGRYTVEVTLSGGSGRARLESPADVTVTNGAATAVVVWDSPHYEAMLVNGTYYAPVHENGTSAFEIPAALDEDMAVSARTVAMSRPHEIDYTLRFDSATLRPSPPGGGLNPLGLAAAAAGVIGLTAGGRRLLLSRRRARGRGAAEGK